MERVFQEYVGRVKAEGKTVLLSSHILSEVERLCDRVGIIRGGEIIESGTLDELRHLTRTGILVKTKS
ncbi:ABC transporter ATP-binding protein, partial [Pseudomonas sp. 2995-1]